MLIVKIINILCKNYNIFKFYLLGTYNLIISCKNKVSAYQVNFT